MSPVDFEPTESPSTPPPTQAIMWVEQQVGKRVLAVDELAGGISSAVHGLTLDDGVRLVLRRYTLADWIEREPYIPHDEARNLTLLPTLDLGVATPTLVAADPEGRWCDAPAIVMTEVPGRPVIDPAETVSWADALAACLARMHEQPAVAELPAFRRWDDPARPVPTWTSAPELWKRAKRLVAGELPRHPDGFLHRDFHPNNIHWDRGTICGVVDWLGACTGPIAVDLAHCRWNLAILADPATADRFTDRYRALAGYSEDVQAYDLSTVLSGPVGPFATFAWNALGRDDLTSESVAPKIDAWLDHVLS